VMVQAYRLLVQKLEQEGCKPYPLHLGVTEAGDGEDGRIKSSVGIGTLLEDGLGDTIRVSLTEEPEAEIPVAKSLADRYSARKASAIPVIDINPINPFQYSRRHSHEVVNFGNHQVPRVVADLSGRSNLTPATLFGVGYNYSVPLDKWQISDLACDYIFAGHNIVDFDIPGTLGIIYPQEVWAANADKPRVYPMFTASEYKVALKRSPFLNFVVADISAITPDFLSLLKSDLSIILVIETNNNHGMAEQRRLFIELMNANISSPVVIRRSYKDLSVENLQLYAATDIGALLIDGLGDGIMISAVNCGGDKIVNETAFNILQATRTRISKTEYISCPSCGRTLFDLQETTAKIRSRTYHLKGVKIGIMGCIVNGPGEMADADYGYVGSGPGRITLYRGKEVVKRNIPTANAVDALIGLIREDGIWVEPPIAEQIEHGK
jgi:(E)-4-hydroxy-3-methylbut-2-enyl-diphosphate synthase